MSVLDYCKKLVLFSSQEMMVMKLLINEFLIDTKLCEFIKTINIDKEIEFYWYKDSSDKVLGGFHILSGLTGHKKYAIYINCSAVNLELDDIENSKDRIFDNVFNRITTVIATCCHELKHYHQFRSCPLLYFILQFPILRNFTVEVGAYKISDYVDAQEDITGMTPLDQLCLKIKYHFPKMYYDKTELKFFNLCLEKNIDPMKTYYKSGNILGYAISEMSGEVSTE